MNNNLEMLHFYNKMLSCQSLKSVFKSPKCPQSDLAFIELIFNHQSIEYFLGGSLFLLDGLPHVDIWLRAWRKIILH